MLSFSGSALGRSLVGVGRGSVGHGRAVRNRSECRRVRGGWPRNIIYIFGCLGFVSVGGGLSGSDPYTCVCE